MPSEDFQRIWLSSPTMHGDEMKYMQEAFDTNWMSTVGDNINSIEEQVADLIGCCSGVALSSGTASLHLAIKLAGVKRGDKVLCSDLTFSATVNPVVYEGGTPIFVDSEYDTWNMDPDALERAFEIHPEAKVVVLAHLYGTPAKIEQILKVVKDHGAILLEDAAESMGATYQGAQTGRFGNYGCISFNGNKIITGSSGGMLLCNNAEDATRARKWSTQAREMAPWYQHEEIGYNYRMSNVVAGVVRGQLPYLDDHIARKRAIYNRYCEGFRELPVEMNPYENGISQPNHWLSCLLINRDALSPSIRDDHTFLYKTEPGKSSPHEILDSLLSVNAEGRPIWKPMHAQPVFCGNGFVVRNGDGRARTSAYTDCEYVQSVADDIFSRGVCLPSDIKMSEEQQDLVIDAVKKCFE